MRVWDVRRAFQALKANPDLKGVPLWMQGKHEMAGIALYAAIFEPDVARLDLWHLPASHKIGPTFSEHSQIHGFAASVWHLPCHIRSSFT